MKLRGDKIKTLAEANGVSRQDLARSIERTGLKGDRALSAVNNWMAGKDHPRARAEDIRRLAQTIGCEVKDISRFVSMVRFHRGSERKAKLLVDLVRGKTFLEADNLLRFNTKRAAVNVRKALNAARADAELQQADVELLVVSESRVDRALHIKRFKAKDRGRAHPILKRTAHITVGVEERN
ncbi:MAG: 50S ribosomal protein L22 [Phycisphaeraceae bacterium]|nr:50S ribosomal protein L22 [Phycisphaeraceae bacterium]MBX3367189.1 50S ribosomal protein L22 [Phycisphaeraceae bacterium]QYK49461.1 MAG: 50S ribosomal protein L22 [Phycisphaeraceae bacterium]